jgi:hypothetical protein
MADEAKKGEEKKSRGAMTGVLIAVGTTVFGAIIAPTLVGIGKDYFNKKVLSDDPTHTQQPPPTQGTQQQIPPPPPPFQEPGNGGNVGGNAEIKMITPDLGEHFYTYTWKAKDKPPARGDPKKELEHFRYVANPPSITVNARGALAGLVTKDQYQNYELRVDFRWGKKTWPPREDKRRQTAILLHAVAPTGGATKDPPWSASVAVLLDEGDTGGIRLLGPKTEGMAWVKESNNRHRRDFYEGKETDFKLPVKAGDPTGWDGTIHRLGFPEGMAKDQLGWRPPGDPTKPDPEWNELLIIADGDKVTVNVNNQRVNEILGLNVKKGHIIFTSNHADYSLGKIDLTMFNK